MIDLEALKQAMASVTDVGHYEHTFAVNDTTVTMWPLTATAEREIFEFSQEALEGRDPNNKDDQASSVSYMDRFRIATISHTIVAIGDLDLRHTNEVLTGKETPGGTPQKIFRYQAMQQIIEGWSKPLIDQLFIQFGEMVRRVEEKAHKAIKFTPANLSSEIDNLLDRMIWLQDQVNRQQNPSVEHGKRIREAVEGMTQTRLDYRRHLVERGELSPDELEEHELPAEPSPPVEAEAQPSAQAQPKAPEAFPDHQTPPPSPKQVDELGQTVRRSTAPPPRRAAAPPSPSQTAAAPLKAPDRAPEAEQTKAPTREEIEAQFRAQNPDISASEPMENFTATGDSMLGDNEEASLAAESARQARLRQQRIEKELAEQRAKEESFVKGRGAEPDANLTPAQRLQQAAGGQVVPQPTISTPNPGGVPQVAPGQPLPAGVHPPHAGAAATAASIEHMQQVHTTDDGVPVYGGDVPREMLTKRTKASTEAAKKAKVKIDGTQQSNNPRFVGRRRQS